MFLRKLKTNSGASRNIVKLTTNWLDKSRYNKLTWRKKSIAGRGNLGRVILWSKGSIKKRLRFPRINYNHRLSRVSFISTFYLIPFQNKLVALCFLSTGSVTYLQSTTTFRAFSFLVTLWKAGQFSTGHFASYDDFDSSIGVLMRIRVLSKVSLLELYPGAGVQYIRSAGSSGRFIKLDLNTHTALVRLPSGVRKSFSLYSIASIGAVSLRIKRLVRNTKAGFWKSYGCKSIVRGVAMNPIDHPHGGRTKTIKNPRTPWGKPTKLK